MTRAGRVTADMAWERITYFLETHHSRLPRSTRCAWPATRTIPAFRPKGYQGVTRVLGTVDGLKRFVSIKESPYHGLNFCQGTVSEMLQDPGKEIYDVIRYFGSRQKIFNVHFRNIRGHRDEFVETYPDEGDVDFVKAIQTYKEVGYPYLLMPDHVPVAPNDPGGLQSFAYLLRVHSGADSGRGPYGLMSYCFGLFERLLLLARQARLVLAGEFGNLHLRGVRLGRHSGGCGNLSGGSSQRLRGSYQNAFGRFFGGV